ncbi:MAG: murein biosynthesis integral membrane protein MurJ [bacterium]|nr:murein biosynthesis integral membrane protein MurJ [bacterium]
MADLTISPTRTTQTIAASAALIAVLGIASRVLGLLRDRALASTYGAGPVLDAYQAAFRIPDFAYNLLGLAALSAAFLPTFVRLRAGDQARAMVFASRILSMVALALAALAACGVLFAGPLYRLLAPGFSADQLALTVALGRVLFPATLLLGCSAVVGGILQAEQRFLAFAAAPIAYNAGIIVGVVVFAPAIGPVGIAWGVVLGAAAHLGLQWIAASRAGFRFRIDLAWGDADVRATARRLLPRALALGASQVQLVVIAAIATTLTAGTLASFSFAVNIQSVPIALIGVAFALAVFPRLSGAIAAGDRTAFQQHFSSAFRQIALLAFPAAVGMLTLKAQGVRVLLGSGAFDWDDTVRTLSALEAFGYGLPFAMFIPLLTRSFYAFEDTRTPFIVSIVADIVGIAVAWTLGRTEGARGLALAISAAAALQATLLLALLRMRMSHFDDRRLMLAVGRFACAALVMGIVIQYVKPIVASWTGTDTFLGIGLQGTFAGALGLVAYFAVGILLRSEEITALARVLHRRVLRTVTLPFGGADEARG